MAAEPIPQPEPLSSSSHREQRERDEILCPRCRWIALRTARGTISRFVSRWIPLKRYTCIRCEWSGLRIVPRE